MTGDPDSHREGHVHHAASLPRSDRGTLPRAAEVAAVAASFFASLVLAYFLSDYLYGVTGYHPQGLARQLITFAGGMLLMATAGSIVARFSGHKLIDFWQSLNTAIQQMATGDFDVSLEIPSPYGRDVRIRELVHSINHMAGELGQLEQMRQEFISNVSHDIQSPLTSIIGFVEALKPGDLPEERRLHYLDIIKTESSRLSKLSQNLLRLTSLESGQISSPRVFNLDQQLRDAVLSMEPQWVAKGIQIKASLESYQIVAMEDLLGEVWLNLLHNAIKFTPERGMIGVTLIRRGDHVEVSISDTGVGIAQPDLERIFERFYKADKSRNRAAEGNGLGLAIVKKIVDVHHGTINVESHVGHDTTFTVILPRDSRTSNPSGNASDRE